MASIKMYLDNFMEKLKKDNPDANWTNLLTGIGILVLVAVFSVWYFGKNEGNVFSGSGSDDGSQEMQGKSDDVEVDENGKPLSEHQVKVQAGEGLWHVSERVCGDGELYNYVANENDLSVWSSLNEGQILTVTCDYKTDSQK